MLFTLKKIAGALILPPTSLILLAIVGLWLSKKHQRTGSAIVAVSLTTLIFLSLPVTGKTLLKNLEATSPISASQLRQVQAIVVLGAGKNLEAPEYAFKDTVSSTTLERLRYAAFLQRNGAAHIPILVTGGAPYGGRAESEAAADVLLAELNATDLIIENNSNNTAENAVFSAKILREKGVSRIALVSQAWHLARAQQLFEREGFLVVPAPTGFIKTESNWAALWLPNAQALSQSSTAIKEHLAILITKINTFIP